MTHIAIQARNGAVKRDRGMFSPFRWSYSEEPARIGFRASPGMLYAIYYLRDTKEVPWVLCPCSIPGMGTIA
jgi:hypothetical protein